MKNHTKQICYYLLVIICFNSLPTQLLAQWENTGIESGFNISIGVSPVNPNFVLTGGDIKGGIYRSIDGGETWDYAGNHMQQFLCFAFDPENEDIAFAGSSTGLFKTTDQGLNWTKQAFNDSIIHSLAFNPNNQHILYVGTGSQAWDGTGYGIYKSTDVGESFASIGLSPNLITEIIVSEINSNEILASCGSGVFKSNDSGENWDLIGPIKDAVVGLPTSSIAWNGQDSIYACTFYQPEEYYREGTVFLSDDGGISWDSLRSFQSSIESIKTDVQNPDVLYVAVFESFTCEPGIWKSSDAGQNWEFKSNGIIDRMLKDVSIDPSNPLTLYTTGDGGGGVYKTTDGGENWEEKTNGMTYFIGYQTKHFKVGLEDYIYSINSFGVYKNISQLARMKISDGIWEQSGIMNLTSVDYNQTMISLFDITQDPENDMLVYSGGMAHSGGIHNNPPQGIFYRSSDAGMTWDNPYYFDFRLINSIEVLYEDDQQIILTGTGGETPDSLYGVWKSFDGGISFSPTTGWFPGVQIMDLVTDPFNFSNVIASTTIGIFKSSDYGSSWTISPAFDIESLKLTYRVIMDTATNGRIFTANGGWLINADTCEYGGVSWSTDSWDTRIDGGLDHDNITSLAICGNLIFAGNGGPYTITAKDTITGKGVWFADANQSELIWQALDTAGMERKFILSLACYDSIIYAGTLGGGVWKYDLHEIINNIKPTEICCNTSIDLWPNPSSSSVNIKLNEKFPDCDTKALVAVFNTTGECISQFEKHTRELQNGFMWDAQNLASGEYSIIVIIGSRIYNSKLILMK